MNGDAAINLFQYLCAGLGFANDHNGSCSKSQEQNVEK